MKIMAKKEVSANLVKRVNELFSDLEGNEYDNIHDEIFVDEAMNWKEWSKRYFSGKGAMVVLDFSAGTGFVPSVMLDYLADGSEMKLVDISREKLEICKKKFSQVFTVNFEYIKIDSDTMSEIPSNSVDAITVNSVLHHLPDYKKVLREFDRLLKKDGILMVAHEPNYKASRSVLLKMINFIISPKDACFDLVLKLGLYDKFSKLTGENEYKKICQKINDQLLKEGVIGHELKLDEIFGIIDIHVARGGIDFQKVRKECLPNFGILEYGTCNYLKKSKKLDFLKKIFPNRGLIFYSILHKIN